MRLWKCKSTETIYFILTIGLLLDGVAYIVTKQICFLYLALAFTILAATYLGYFRTRIRKKFNTNNQDVTDAIQKVSSAYDCKIVGVFSHQLKQFVIDGNKVLFSVTNPESKLMRQNLKKMESITF